MEQATVITFENVLVAEKPNEFSDTASERGMLRVLPERAFAKDAAGLNPRNLQTVRSAVGPGMDALVILRTSDTTRRTNHQRRHLKI